MPNKKDTSNAGLSNDVAVIKSQLKGLESNLEDKFKKIDISFNGVQESLNCLDSRYVTREKHDLEVQPLIKNMDRVTWLIVSSVIVALLAIILTRNGVQ